jgi:hypothetical protein
MACLAVFKRIGRGGLGIGGASGRGQVYVGGEVTGFSRLMDIAFGAQAGGQAYRGGQKYNFDPVK